MSHLRILTRVLYPNWVNIAFFTENWGLFFGQEIYNLSVLLGLVFLWHLLLAGWGVGSVLTHVAVVVGARRLLAGGLCTSAKWMVNRTVIVTGANIGIGRETARDMYRRGARVILACRDVGKGEVARLDISQTGGGGKVEVRKLDLSSLQSVRQFAAGIKKDGIQVHVLINNAGVMMCPYMETTEGFELQMGTNHLGHFLLTNLLLPQMKQHGQPARIVNVSSLGHNFAKLDLDDFNYKKGYDKVVAYGNSKLANILFTRQLAKELKGSKIQVFALHPGAVYSNLTQHVMSKNFNDYVAPLMQKTTLEGAQTTIYCALEAEQDPEMYFSDCAVGWASPAAKDDQLADKLWKLSAKLVKLE